MKSNFILAIAFFACFALHFDSRGQLFKHEVKSKATPWTYEPAGKLSDQFAFAIIGDLNSGERSGVFEVAAEQINLLKPKFVLSIGDLIDGGTEDTLLLKKQFDSFDLRAGKMGAPFFHTGGNHDLTNLIMRKFWEKRYGRRYYHFLYNNILFLVLDSEDYEEMRMQEIYVARKRAIELLDSGKTEQANKSAYFQMPERITGEISDTQTKYFERVISRNPNVRWTFILMHKPVWKKEEGGFSRIERALERRNFTVINGHLHEYQYTQKANHDYIMLGTTGGGQKADNKNAFDHILWVTVTDNGPSVANLKLGGILDKEGKIPLNGDNYCFQASQCGEQKK